MFINGDKKETEMAKQNRQYPEIPERWLDKAIELDAALKAGLRENPEGHMVWFEKNNNGEVIKTFLEGYSLMTAEDVYNSLEAAGLDIENVGVRMQLNGIYIWIYNVI